jgi:hypothetical protein
MLLLLNKNPAGLQLYLGYVEMFYSTLEGIKNYCAKYIRPAMLFG